MHFVNYLKKTSLNISKILFFLLILSLFLSIRHVFFTNSAFQTGAYSDFTSFSLYLSDILLFLLFFSVIVPRGRGFWLIIKTKKSIVFLIIWLILGAIWHFRTFSSLNWYFLLKYAELLVSYGTVSYLFNKIDIKFLFFKFFVFLATFESLLALFQFIYQKSTNLLVFNKLGEQILNPNILGVAKIVSGGTKLIRGYGTFPHPNLLSAFLVTSVVFSLYLMLNGQKKWEKLTLSALLFINVVGLTVTFSRSGYLALGISSVFLFGYLLAKTSENIPKKKVWGVLMIFCGLIIVSFLLFRPYILTRTTITDQASIDRSAYNKIGLQMAKDRPLFGTGIGESVLHMEQYSKTKLEPWQKQPIHNYFLLAAAELGIPGALILIWIFLSHLWALLKNFKLSTNHLALATILFCFLILMQFDHYFYTLEQTQMLLWIILGIIAAEIKISPSGGEIDL